MGSHIHLTGRPQKTFKADVLTISKTLELGKAPLRDSRCDQFTSFDQLLTQRRDDTKANTTTRRGNTTRSVKLKNAAIAALQAGQLVGRPSRVPLARARSRPALTRATISSRSNSAKTENMPNLGAGVVVSCRELGCGYRAQSWCFGSSCKTSISSRGRSCVAECHLRASANSSRAAQDQRNRC